MKFFIDLSLKLIMLVVSVSFFSCQHGKEMATLNSSFEQMQSQEPKSLLDVNDLDQIWAAFDRVELHTGENKICKLQNGAEITFEIMPDYGYKIFANYDGKKEEATTQAIIPIMLGDSQTKKLINYLQTRPVKIPDHTDPSYRKILTPLYWRNLTPLYRAKLTPQLAT